MGFRRSQLMSVCSSVIDGIADARRRNVEGQMDLFGMADAAQDAPPRRVELPDIPEYRPHELMEMEREVTGMYLSGHPIDAYRERVKKSGAVQIGRILSSFGEESEQGGLSDDQPITVAGVIAAMKTKTTRNNSLMAYVTLEDGSGSIETLVFQRALDAGGAYLRAGFGVIIKGRLSVRDEKDPQIVADSIRPLSDLDVPGETPPEDKRGEKKLYVRLSSESDPAYERLRLILVMFPGDDQLVLYFSDTKKRLGTQCVIHPALIRELTEMLGEDNVIVK